MGGTGMRSLVDVSLRRMYAHEIQRPMSNAGCGRELAGKVSHGNGRPLQDHGLEAVVMIEMHVH